MPSRVIMILCFVEFYCIKFMKMWNNLENNTQLAYIRSVTNCLIEGSECTIKNMCYLDLLFFLCFQIFSEQRNKYFLSSECTGDDIFVNILNGDKRSKIWCLMFVPCLSKRTRSITEILNESFAIQFFHQNWITRWR